MRRARLRQKGGLACRSRASEGGLTADRDLVDVLGLADEQRPELRDQLLRLLAVLKNRPWASSLLQPSVTYTMSWCTGRAADQEDDAVLVRQGRRVQQELDHLGRPFRAARSGWRGNRARRSWGTPSIVEPLCAPGMSMSQCKQPDLRKR